MYNFKVSLNDILPEGLTITVDEPAVWAEPVVEFGLSLRIIRPLTAELFVLPQEDGVLLRGRVQGEVAMPCDRCAEEALIAVDHSFDDFEEYPVEPELDYVPAPKRTEELELQEDSVLILENGAPFLDVSCLLWEEFSLALPVKPLCRPACKGVCPQCGKNLNDAACSCSVVAGDPRMAALRAFKVKQ